MSNKKDMGVIARNKHQITLYFHPDSQLGTKSLAVAKSSNAKVHTVDLSKTKLTGTEWAELADLLNKNIQELIEKEHPAYTDKYEKNVDLDKDSAIKILQNSPEVMSFPIAVRGEKAVQATNSTSLLSLQDSDSKDAPLP
ncbi:MAG: arsenate reductase family protein [Bacteroidota bacterium]